MWQDMLIFVVSLVLSYGLVVQVIHGFKDKKGHITFQTGLVTTIGMYLITISFFTLGMLFSGMVTFFNGTMWLTLFIQKLKYN